MLLTVNASFPMIWVWLFLACFCLFFNTGPTNTILAKPAFQVNCDGDRSDDIKSW